jgi:hypothetical protein
MMVGCLGSEDMGNRPLREPMPNRRRVVCEDCEIQSTEIGFLGAGYGVRGMGYEVRGAGCGMQGVRCAEWGVGFGVWGAQFGVQS